jgi:integrase
MKLGTLITQAQATKFLIMDEGKRQNISDSQVRGLQLERLRLGFGKWRIRATSSDGRERICMTLGDTSNLSLADARAAAQKISRSIAMGDNPKQQRQEGKLMPTVSAFIHDSYLPFVQGYKRSWKCDQGLLRKHIEPIWGTKYLDYITKPDVIALMAKHRTTHAPGSCNRLLILLRYVFSCSIKWEISGIKANPTAGIPLMKEDNVKERYLSEEEAQRLYAQLNQSDNKMLKFIIPMLLLTGARKREVLDARWEDFDYGRRLWRIHTTKLGKPRFVPMSDGVIKLLESVPRHDSEWAFPNPKTLKPYVSIYYSWNTARIAAGLSDFRCHDARHSFASFLVNAGRSLYEVQRLLGHTQIKTTQRYAHLSQDTLLAATNAASNLLDHVFSPVALPLHTTPPTLGVQHA